MKFENKLASAFKIIQNRFSKKGRPVALRWNLTYRCNLNCEYCNLPEKASKENELSTEKVKEILKEMAEVGIKRISFSGGEPLLREDIGEIFDFAAEVGISPTVNTNGVLVPKKVDELQSLDLMKISVDGKKSTHNRLRGFYEEMLKGLETAEKNNIKTSLCTTFTKKNYEDLDDVIELADQHNTLVAIQRVTNLHENFEDAEGLLPRKEEVKSKIQEVINLKAEKPDVIRNSERHLKLIKNYPEHDRLRCTAGKLFCIVLPDGTVTPCDRIHIKQDLPNLKNESFEDAFKELKRVDCDGCCFCGSMELNYLYHLKIDVIRELMNLL